ncbi:MAG TPA: class I SAM-dependent methyltransferase [Rhizomicrobium sp.]|nr:class I SAM-dependent methyltransferase [Rhizomicrobium sp.]
MPRHEEIFNDIYRRDLWQGGSGAGSREEMTRDYRALLLQFMARNAVASVVDLGCGDWQFSRHVDWSGIDYTGIDVSSVVLENTAKFSQPGVRFLQADATSDALPGADLLLAKDVLQHWSNADILAFLPKLANYKYALITGSFPQYALGHVNRDMPTGANFRPVDPAKPPFNLKGGFILSFVAGDPKLVFLWTRS